MMAFRNLAEKVLEICFSIVYGLVLGWIMAYIIVLMFRVFWVC